MNNKNEIENIISETFENFKTKLIKDIIKREKDLERKFKTENELEEFYFDFLFMINILKKYLSDENSYDLKEVIVPILVALNYVDKSWDDLPDIIPFIGYMDDAFVMKYITGKIKKFLE